MLVRQKVYGVLLKIHEMVLEPLRAKHDHGDANNKGDAGINGFDKIYCTASLDAISTTDIERFGQSVHQCALPQDT